MTTKLSITLAVTTALCLATMSVRAQSVYSNAVMSLNPAGYWPMHEVAAAAPGDIETNYGTLGLLGTGYYPDWATTPAVALKRQHAGPFTVAGNTNVSVNFTHNLITGSTEQFTNMLFIPHAAPLTTLNPPFSVECWFYPTNLSTGVDIWSQCGDEGLNAGAEGGTIGYISGMRLVWVNSGFVIYAMNNQYDTGSANSNRLVFQEAATGSNQWYHLVVTCDANTNVSLFTNGVQAVSTVSAVSRFSPDYWTPLTVGGGYGATRSIAGYISEFAVYTNALSSVAVASHYSDGLNVGAGQYYSDVVSSNPAIYLRMNSPAYSPAGFGSLPVLYNLGTINGVAVGNGVYSAGTAPGILSGPANTNGAAFAGVTNNSPLLSGVSSFADAGSAAGYNPTGSNANFTITAMFRGYPSDGRIQSIVGHGTNSWVLTVSTNGCIVFNAGNGNNKAVEGTSQASGDISTTGIYNDGNWHQVVVVNQTNLVSIYVDAGLDTNGTPNGVTATNIIPGNSSDVLIGSDPSYTNTPAGVGRNLAGQVCEVAFFTNALSPGQVAMLYSNSGVIVAPSITVQPPANQVVNGGTGSSVQFHVGAKGTPALSYQWYFNTASNYTGAAKLVDNVVHYANSETAQLSVTNLTQNDSGYYFVIVTNQYGSATSIVASLTVNTSPTIVSQFPLTYTNLFALYAGASPDFTVNVDGTSPFSYQWFTNGVLDGAATTNTLQVTNVQASFTNYCIVANVSGSVTNSWAAMVIPDPVAPYPQQVLALNPVGYWRMNDTNLDGVDTATGDFGWVCHDYAGGNDGIYTNCQLGFTGYNPLSDPSDTAAQFGEIDLLGADFGDSLAFGIEGINFGTPAGMNGAFSVEAWVSGYIQTTAGAGIVSLGYGGGGEQFCLDCGAPNNAFRFFFRDASGSAHVINSSVEASTVSQTLGPWYHLAGVVDEVHGNMAFYIDGQLAGLTPIAAGSGVQAWPDWIDIGSRMGGPTTNYNYQFLGNINDVAIFNYALSSNQVAGEYLNAGDLPPFLSELPPTNETIAAGSTLAISAAAAGTGPLGYYWTDVNARTNVAAGTTNGLTLNASVTVINVPAAWNGDQLELTVTNAFGSTNFNVTLSVLTSPAIVTNIPSQFTLAQGRTYTYSVGAVGASPLFYQWYSGATPVAGQTNSTYTLTASGTGVFYYSVVVTNYLGSATSIVSTVTVVPTPTSVFATNILGLNPAGYWPMHELEAPAPGDIETNYGTLGVLGNGYYPDWASTPAVSIIRQQSGPMANNSDPDSAVNFTHYVSNLSTPAFTNGLFVPHASPLTTLNPPFTVECWFYPINLGPGAPLWAQTGNEGLNAGAEGGGQGYVTGMFLNWAQGGFVAYNLDDSLDGTFGNAQKVGGGSGGTEFLGSNAWYHVVITCDANTNMTYFTNGVECERTFADVGDFSPDYWTPLSICSGVGDLKSLAGDMAEFAVYTNALSTNEISYHYAIGTNSAPQTNYFTAVMNDGPAIYFRMDSPSYNVPPANTWPLLLNYGSAGVNGVYAPGSLPGVLPGPVNVNGAPSASLSGANVALLSGVSSFADAGSTPSFNPVGKVPFSVTAIFRGNPCDGRVQDIVGHSDNSWRIMMNTNGALRCAIGTDGNNVVDSTGVYNDGNWHQVVDVYQPASNPNVTGTNALYVDGVLDTAVTSASTNGIGPGSTSDVFIGSDPEYTNSPAGVGRQFAGQICEVALFTNALTAAQVQSLYQAVVSSGINTTPTNIVFSVANKMLTLSWPADHIGWRLQAQTNRLAVGISTNWVDVTGTAGTNLVTFPINPANGTVFYRLTYP